MTDYQKEMKRLLDRYAEGNISEEERAVLDEFFEENKRIALASEVRPEQYKLLEQRLKNEIDSRISPPARSLPLFYRMAAAMAVIGIVTYLVMMQKNDNLLPSQTPVMLTKVTERGQKATLRLPDGTVVRLNSTSKLVFPEKFAGDSREVSLEGEGYFEVVHNPSSPFIVRTAESSIQVLGTSFNVNEKSSSSTEVTLVTGKVEVSTFQGESVQLKPNQQAVIQSGVDQIDTARVDVTKYIEWKDDVLRFERTPMKEVVAKLEEWYGVDIEIGSKQIEGCRITGRYESESLENVLESFEFMLNGSFTLSDSKATITGKGCNGNN